VEISIVSLGDAAQLSRCVHGLPAACAGIAWLLSVVDNSPAGLEVGALHAAVPWAAVVRSEGRRGFGANQNLVLESLVDAGRARYALILNDDTELDADAVTRLVRHADAEPKIGAVSPIIRDRSGRREAELFAWPRVWEQLRRMMLPRLPPRRPPRSGWLNGAAMLVRTATLRDVGVFDSSFFLFFEDTDLCLRIVRAGWSLDVCQTASLVHHGHGTTGQCPLSLAIEQQMLRSRYLFFCKHHGSASAQTLSALSRCALAVRAAKAATMAWPRGDGAQKARVLWALARYAPTRPTVLEP